MFEFQGRKLADYDLVRGNEEYDELGIDSFLESATWDDTGEDLTEAELEAVNDDQDLIYRIVEHHIY